MDNYLRVLYNNWEIGLPRVSNQEIAFKLNTSPSTVSITVNKLSEMKYNQSPLIMYEKYHGVQLTKAGLDIANLVERKYRIFETFLAYLGNDLFSISRIIDNNYFDYELADNIYHQLQQKGVDIDFKHCPHGSIIPSEYDYHRRDSRLFSMSANGYFAIDQDYTFAKYDEFVFNAYRKTKAKREVQEMILKLDLRFEDTITITNRDETSVEIAKAQKRTNIPNNLAKMMYLIH